jgi:hypothetical protein
MDVEMRFNSSVRRQKTNRRVIMKKEDYETVGKVRLDPTPDTASYGGHQTAEELDEFFGSEEDMTPPSFDPAPSIEGFGVEKSAEDRKSFFKNRAKTFGDSTDEE